MTRTQNTPVTKRRRKRTLKRVKGENEFKNAREKLNKSLIHAYRDRKKKKSFFRQVWIVRLNVICRKNGLSYSRFIHLLILNQIKLNRKQLTEMPEAQLIRLITKLKNS